MPLSAPTSNPAVPPPAPRILVVGSGALGGYFGARLLAAGRDVTFLVRPARAAQMARDGLHVISPKGNLDIAQPPTVLAQDLRAPYDLILLTCKAQDLESAIVSFAPAVGPSTAILPLLNGMAHLAVLDERFGRKHVLGGGCIISATRDAAGAIQHLNKLDRLFFGDRDDSAAPRMQALHAALSNAGFDIDLRPNVLHDMWQKWTYIAASAGITCLFRATIGDIVSAGAAQFALDLFAECIAIATHEGYPPAPAFIEASTGYLTKDGSPFTASMMRDLESGAPIEAHQIIGDLLTYAHKHQLQTPLLHVVNASLRCYEERRLRQTL